MRCLIVKLRELSLEFSGRAALLKSCLLSGSSMFTSTGCMRLADSLKLGRRSQGCCPEARDRESSRNNVDVSSCPTPCVFLVAV